MTIVGILATALPSFGPGGGINADASFSTTHTFGPSSIWGRPQLQHVAVNDRDGAINAFVSQFVNNTGVHNVHHIGDFVDNCTSITYTTKMHNCIGLSVCITEFLSK
jgi:hypothetical protein